MYEQARWISQEKLLVAFSILTPPARYLCLGMQWQYITVNCHSSNLFLSRSVCLCVFLFFFAQAVVITLVD